VQNTKPLLAALLIAAVTPAQAQTLPAPLFATPGASDASGRAATTAWVRSQGYLSSVTSGQVAAALGFAPQRAAVFNVLDFGAVADGVTDIGPALRLIAAKLNAGTANVVLIPAGSYALNSAVVFANGAPTIEGQGYNEGATPTSGSGTWLTINAAGFVPITFSGAFARGAIVRNIAVTQVHPSQVSGWAPTNYDYVFKVLNTLGEVTFDNVLFAGVNRGIYADNSGRLLIRKVTGQFFTAGVEIDDCYDIPRIDYLHAWTYATTSPYVLAWQEAHLDTVILRRVDGIFIGDLFTFGARDALYLTSGGNGVTTKLYANSVYADFSKYAVLADGNGINGQFGKVTSQHQDFAAGGGAVVAASRGMLITGNTDQFQIAQWRSNSVGGPAIDVEGYNNRVTVSDLWANTYGVTPGDGTPAVFVADSGANAANFVQVQGTPFLQGAAPLYLYNAGVNAGRLRMPSMNAGGNDANEPRLFSNGAGNPVSLAAIGSDASVDLQLQAKSVTGSVKLQANGQTVVRVDDANSGSDDVLFRSGAGTMNLIAEGGDTNIDYFVTPKGVTGGVRLQANGSTTLRTDNPNAVADDLLVRPGASTMALTAEGTDANINLVLNPKGNGTVALGTSPTLTDNSPNVVTSAWVKGQAYLVAAPVSSVAARTGAITLTHSDVTDWISATGAFLTGITSSQVTTALGYTPTSGGITALTGDAISSGGGSASLTLATVNGSTGAFGNSTSVPTLTVNAKGLVTAASATSIPTAGASTAGLITTTAAAAAAPVQSVNGGTGAVTGLLNAAAAATTYAPKASPTFAGTVTVSGSANNATVTGAAAGNAATIAATGMDTSVDLFAVAQGSAGSVRLRANGVTVLRTDSPGAGTSDLLVRGGVGAVALTVEGAANGNLVLNPAGTGTVVIPTVATTDNSSNAASTAFVRAQGFVTSGVLQVDSFTASGAWTLNPAAKYIRAILIGCGSSGAGGATATAGTAYSGGAGGSAAEAMVIEGPAISFSSGAVTLCTAPAGGAAASAGIAGGSAVWNGHTAFGGGAPAPGAAGISAGSGGSAGYRGGGGNASGATAGSAGAGSGSAGSTGSGIGNTVAYLGGSGAGGTVASTGSGGNAIQGPAGGGGGGYMPATQVLVAGGAGGVTLDGAMPAGGATAGATGTAGGNLVMGYGSGGGGGGNNINGAGGAGGAGGVGAGGGGGGDGSTAGGTGGVGGAPLLRVVQW